MHIMLALKIIFSPMAKILLPNFSILLQANLCRTKNDASSPTDNDISPFDYTPRTGAFYVCKTVKDEGWQVLSVFRPVVFVVQSKKRRNGVWHWLASAWRLLQNSRNGRWIAGQRPTAIGAEAMGISFKTMGTTVYDNHWWRVVQFSYGNHYLCLIQSLFF